MALCRILRKFAGQGDLVNLHAALERHGVIPVFPISNYKNTKSPGLARQILTPLKTWNNRVVSKFLSLARSLETLNPKPFNNFATSPSVGLEL